MLSPDHRDSAEPLTRPVTAAKVGALLSDAGRSTRIVCGDVLDVRAQNRVALLGRLQRVSAVRDVLRQAEGGGMQPMTVVPTSEGA